MSQRAPDEAEAELERLDALFELMSGYVQRPLPLTDDQSLDREVSLHVRPSRQLSPLQRLDVYRQQFWLRHADSLAEDFPGTSALFGSEWETIVHGYLAAFPPTTPSLRELGFKLPEYLAGRPEAVARPRAIDMAHLERAYLEVFDAPDEPPLDPARVRSLGPEQWPLARLDISGALRLLELGSHAADLRRALRAGETVECEQRTESVYLAVYRRDLCLWDKEVSRTACELLRHLTTGVPLGVACERTARDLPEAARELDTQVAEWFADWTRSGWITGVHPG